MTLLNPRSALFLHRSNTTLHSRFISNTNNCSKSHNILMKSYHPNILGRPQRNDQDITSCCQLCADSSQTQMSWERRTILQSSHSRAYYFHRAVLIQISSTNWTTRNSVQTVSKRPNKLMKYQLLRTQSLQIRRGIQTPKKFKPSLAL